MRHIRLTLAIPPLFIAGFLAGSIFGYQTPSTIAAGPGCANNPDGCLHNPPGTCMQNCSCKRDINDESRLEAPRRFASYWITWDMDATSFLDNETFKFTHTIPDWHVPHMAAEVQWSARSINLHLWEGPPLPNAGRIATKLWDGCTWGRRHGGKYDDYGHTYFQYQAGSQENLENLSLVACPDGFPCNWNCYAVVKIRFNGFFRWQQYDDECGDEDAFISASPIPPTCPRAPYLTDKNNHNLFATKNVGNGTVTLHEFGHALGLYHPIAQLLPGDVRIPETACYHAPSPTIMVGVDADCDSSIPRGCSDVHLWPMDDSAIQFLYGP